MITSHLCHLRPRPPPQISKTIVPALVVCSRFFLKIWNWSRDVTFEQKTRCVAVCIVRTVISDLPVYVVSLVRSSHGITYTGKNSEKKICPFLESEDFFLKMNIFFLKTANYSPIWGKKNPHFREKDIFFLGFFCSVGLHQGFSWNICLEIYL